MDFPASVLEKKNNVFTFWRKMVYIRKMKVEG
jgi:hypothetical protein